MKKIILISMLIVSFLGLYAHEGGHGTPLKDWTLELSNESFKADFVQYNYNQNEVWLREANHKTFKIPLADFSFKDQAYILERSQEILALNTKKISETEKTSFLKANKWLLLMVGFMVLFSIFLFIKQKKKVHLISGVFCALFIIFVSCDDSDEDGDGDGGTTDPPVSTDVPANDLSFLESLFESFSGVTTSSDDTYFYIASNGIPEHNMMVGITNWQQQVPIDHNYTGDNSWAIPIQPALAENPLSTRTNLLRGAIAIASNGIPIFNPLNNRGEDANDIGELDQWGGHCGRADDYHYHLPPTHLETTVGDKPIAYALDGFPIYGETNEELDEYLGKFNEDGSYQYHTIAEYPYFIAGMRGEVAIDPNSTAPENQITPQARTRELRPALTPLAGAEITGFELVGPNSYSLTYTVNSEAYMVNYNWDETGLYTYEFVNPDGTSTVETYQR